MRFGDKLAVHIAPLFLRLILGVTFLWAGWAKLSQHITIGPNEAAILANMGVFTPETAPTPESPEPEIQEERALPDPSESLAPETEPEGESADARLFLNQPRIVSAAFQPEESESISPDETPADETPAETTEDETTTAEPEPTPAPAPQYTADQFPDEVRVLRLYKVALLIHARSQPLERDDGTTAGPIVPAWASTGNRPVLSAWGGTLAEVIGGGFIVFGLFSRLSGLAMAGTMVVAAALTTMGPAIQAGATTLGFIPLPPPGIEWHDPAAYIQLFWQFALFGAGLALFCTGSGTFAIDRIFRGKKTRTDDDDD